MKKIIYAATAALFLTAGLAPLQANEMGKTPQQRQEHLSKKLEKMTKELHLTPSQQSTVHDALQAKMDKVDAAVQEADVTIKAALDPEQVKKYDKMMSEKK